MAVAYMFNITVQHDDFFVAFVQHEVLAGLKVQIVAEKTDQLYLTCVLRGFRCCQGCSRDVLGRKFTTNTNESRSSTPVREEKIASESLEQIVEVDRSMGIATSKENKQT